MPDKTDRNAFLGGAVKRQAEPCSQTWYHLPMLAKSESEIYDFLRTLSVSTVGQRGDYKIL